MNRSRLASFVETQKLLATWQNSRRRLVLVVSRVDVRKPLHAVTIGAILAGIVGPVAAQIAVNERYKLPQEERNVIERPAPDLFSKLKYDSAKKATVFNESAEGLDTPPSGDSTAVEGGGGQ